MWEYVKGSEADFEGVPDEHSIILTNTIGEKYAGIELDYMSPVLRLDTMLKTSITNPKVFRVIAQRRKVDDLQSRTNDANLQQAFDTVQRPAHYNQSGIECIDAIAAAVKGKSGIEGVLVGNVIKYLWRYELKGGLESVQKAQWYLDRLVKELSK